MNLLFPALKWSQLKRMAGLAATGVLVAGAFGIVHDQFTYTLSPEYFTQLKFAQFHYADFGFSPRIFVAEIGFLATWWVGLISAWFLGRLVVPVETAPRAWRICLHGFVTIFLAATAGAAVGFTWGLSLTEPRDFAAWLPVCRSLGVEDVRAFVRVGYIHNASYLGGGVGLLIALARVIWALRKRGAVT